MSDFKERFRSARLQKGFSQEKLAEKVGVTQGSINLIEVGTTQNPKHLHKYAAVLDTTVDWLLEGKQTAIYQVMDEGRKIKEIPIKISYVPIIEWEDIGKENQMTLKEEVGFLPVYGIVSSSAYALIVQGDSMVSTNPSKRSIYKGDRLIIEENIVPENGDIVLAILESGEAILRYYAIDGGVRILLAHDPQFPPITITDKIKIKGVATNVLGKLKT